MLAAALSAALLALLARESSASLVSIAVEPATARDAHALLELVLPELLLELGPEAALAPASAAPAAAAVVELALAPGWRRDHLSPAAERYAVTLEERAGAPARLRLSARGLLGLAYGAHALREHAALSGASRRPPPPGADRADRAETWRAALRAFALLAPPAPNFELRSWSEEGQLLALPDRGYYTADGSAANVSVIAAECAALEAEVVPALLRLKMNALIVLHSDLEDYVTYDSLPSFLPGAPAVYNASSAHRARRAGIVGVMAPWVQHLADAFGLQFFFQVYELSSPPGVCGAGGALNCSLTAPATRALLQAKYTEVRAALPALAGIFVTVEDSWTPRAGYEFNVLWQGMPELPGVVTLFHDAVVATAGLKMFFRLWLFGQPVDWPLLRNGTPPDAAFSVKQTQGDFLLDYPINELLKCSADLCPPRDRRVIVELDAFRQYNGWTSTVAYMGAQWAPRLAQAAAAGATDVWGWGAWAPGCTWPDSGPQLVNASAGYKSWRSWWSSYRVFAPTATNGGFALGPQANAYLLSRLSWDALPANETQIALDFGALFFGASNAAPVAALLNASLPAWLATSAPSSVGDFTLFWTMMQHDKGTFDGLARKNVTLAQFQDAADASTAALSQMEAALAAVDPGAVPASNPRGYAGAARAVAVSKGYLAALFAWRSAGLSVALLGAAPSAGACAEARGLVAAMADAVARFGAAFPTESASWVVASLDPALESAPSFLTTTSERTMAGYGAVWTAAVAAVCPP